MTDTTKTIELSSGHAMPALGLGTWLSEPGAVGAAVTEAIAAGYRHIDCAWIYGNEAEIGEALRGVFERGEVQRADLFITSKLWNDRHAPADVEPVARESLERLGLDYLDLYLVHWPVAHKLGKTMPESADDMIALADLPLTETWSAMESLSRAGLCRSIGVSNCSVAKLEQLCAAADIRPAANQIELHPYLSQTSMLEFCRGQGIALTAYSPLGSSGRPERVRAADEPVLLEDPVLASIAAKRAATPAQVLIAWALARGTAVIPKSVTPSRIRENFAAGSIELGDQDMAAIAELDRHRRYVDGTFWAVPGSSYTVANLWDE